MTRSDSAPCFPLLPYLSLRLRPRLRLQTGEQIRRYIALRNRHVTESSLREVIRRSIPLSGLRLPDRALVERMRVAERSARESLDLRGHLSVQHLGCVAGRSAS